MAILATVLLLLGMLALSQSAREMRHEGLTYSQWYEDSIYGFYTCMMVVVACTGLCAALWIVWARAGRAWLANARPGPMKVGPAICVALTILLTAWAIVRRGMIHQAASEGAEALEPYIRAYGNTRVLALIALEASVALGLGLRGVKKQ